MKEELEKLLQYKDKIRRIAITEIEWLKEILWQQKDIEDQMCS